MRVNSTILQFSGVGQINTGWLKYMEKYYLNNESFTINPTILNITRDSDQAIINNSKILWDYYDFQGNYHSSWNNTKVSLQHYPNDQMFIYFNIHVWINETTSFSMYFAILVIRDFNEIPIFGTTYPSSRNWRWLMAPILTGASCGIVIVGVLAFVMTRRKD